MRYQHVAIGISVFLGDIGMMSKLSAGDSQPILLKIGQGFLWRLSKRSIIDKYEILGAKIFNFGGERVTKLETQIFMSSP